MGYKVGDEVLVKGTITDLHEGTDHPYFVAVNYDSVHWVSEDKIIPADKTYAYGLNDAWKMADKLNNMPLDEVEEVLGIQTCREGIFSMITCEQALAKIEAYERTKEIKVGDVVEHNGFKGVVVHILPDGELNIVYENGLFGASCSEREYAKTGKHLEIADLLRKIGE